MLAACREPMKRCVLTVLNFLKLVPQQSLCLFTENAPESPSISTRFSGLSRIIAEAETIAVPAPRLPRYSSGNNHRLCLKAEFSSFEKDWV